MHQQADNAVQKWLTADEPVTWAQRSLEGEVLAAAEADFQLERAIVAEQGFSIERIIARNRDLREQPIDQCGLACT